MSATRKNIYAPAPTTVRAKPTQLTSDPKGKNFLYVCGSSVIIRDIENPLNVDMYDQHSHQTTVARYAPSGFYIASGDVAGNVRIWDTVNAEHILKIEFKMLAGAILDIAWTQDSQRIAVVGEGKDKFGAAFLWDSGASVGEITGHTKAINSVDLKQTRPFRLATGSEDCAVGWFEGPPFKFKGANKEHQRFVNCVRFSPNGERLLSVASDKKGLLFDGKTGEKNGELAADHQGGIYSCAWSPDSTKILTASADKTCKIFDAATGQATTTFTFGAGTEHQQLGCLWQGENLLSVALSGDINYLDRSNPSQPQRVLKGHNKIITALAVDRGNGKFYTGSYDGGIVQWDVDNGRTEGLHGQGHTNQVTKLVVQGSNLISVSMDDTLRTTPTATREYSADKTTLDGQPADLAVSKTDHGLVITVTATEVLVVRNGNVATRTAAAWGPTAVGISTDNAEVVVGGKDGSLHVYRLGGDALTETKFFPGHRGQVTAVTYSPDGRHLATAATDREVFVWDAQTKDKKVNGWVFHTARINSLAWSPSSTHLVSGGLDGNIFVWYLEETGKRIQVKSAHQGAVNVVDFLDENTIISAGADCAAKSWTIKY